MRLPHFAVVSAAVTALALGGLWVLRAQAPPAQAAAGSQAEAAVAYRRAMEQADLAIQKENQEHSELMKNEEYLTTEIGPRLTGSRQMQQATAWTVQKFGQYGLAAHAEPATLPHGWEEGVDTAEILAPWHKVVTVRAEAFSKTTCPAGVAAANPDGTQNPACEITAPVMVVDPGTTVTDADVRGKIVLLGPPASNNMDPDYQADNAYDAVIVPPVGIPTGRGRGGRGFGGRGAGPSPYAAALAVLHDGGKPWGLMSIGGRAGAGGGFSDTASAVMPHQDYALIYRMIEDYHNPVTMRIALRGSITPDPQTASVTVAQIKGAEKPDQQVIIGGHLDSWFLGQGAVDNGTGAMATLEAARILSALGWKPRRTLTFLLFTAEEEGGAGVNAGVRTYIANHKAEMPKVDAVLVDDTGTGKFLSIAMDGFWETAPEMVQVYTPLQEVFGLGPLDARTFGSSDHVSFEAEGIPAYFGVQAAAHYREEHHTQADTFDIVVPDQANQQAAVLAAWMWNVSELDQPFPHHAVSSGGRRGF